jgi:uncharacterized protein YceH (UPF0502 family)
MDVLDSSQVRILGALVEKEMTTPEYYPLSLNALTHACNQSSNRDPVMQLEESVISSAIIRLREKSLVRATKGSDSRVTKYSHLLAERMDLDKPQLALLSLLLLRGAQTLGELKTRAARLVEFQSIADVEQVITGLMTRETPLVVALPRRPNQKETRYAHLLSGEVAADISPETAHATVSTDRDRIASLEAAVDELRNELGDVRRQLDDFRKQFE